MDQEAKKAAVLTGYVTCFLCGETVDLRSSKRGKPYFICDPCGLQAFIRKEPGILKLAGISKPRQFKTTPALEILARLDAVHSKLAEIEDQKPLFTTNPELELAEKALLTEKTHFEKKLRSISAHSGKAGNSKPRNTQN
jgi:hypothetical protein